MKYEIDLHVHTIASQHAYSTIEEIAKQAAKKGMRAFAMTDHGPGAPDGPHRYFFSNMKVIPEYIDGIRIIKGIEANILSDKGELDLMQSDLNKLEIILASFHKNTAYGESNFGKNTEALINVIKNGKVDVLGHLGNPTYPFDMELVIKTASKYGVAIEFNNSSFIHSRPGSEENCKQILKLCKKYNCYISLGSDSHISFDVGKLDKVTEIITEINYNKDLVINQELKFLMSFLKARRNKIEKK